MNQRKINAIFWHMGSITISIVSIMTVLILGYKLGFPMAAIWKFDIDAWAQLPANKPMACAVITVILQAIVALQSIKEILRIISSSDRLKLGL
jgi:hypothetical protein